MNPPEFVNGFLNFGFDELLIVDESISSLNYENRC